MKLRFVLLIATLVTVNALFAQYTDTLKRNMDIHIMPAYLGDPRIRIGVEYRTVNNFGFVLDVGYANGLIQGPSYNIFEIRPELKYYFYAPSEGFTFYTALELYWIEMTKRLQGGSIDIPNSTRKLAFEFADRWTKRTGFHIKSGMRLVPRNKLFSFDIYWGVGVGNIRSHFSNIEGLTIWEPDPYSYKRFDLGLRGEGHLFPYQEIHWTAGIKLGYIFWREK